MSEWRTKPLGEICDVIGGGTPAKDNPAFYEGDIPWATVRDMKSDELAKTEFRISGTAVASSSTNIIPSGNVIIATRVGLGKVCILSQDTAINQDLRGIIPKHSEDILVRFLFWWLKSVAQKIIDEGTGATVQGVKLPFVKGLEVPLPSLPEQRRIVAILDEAFAGLDAMRANAEKNLQNARELFDSYLNAIFSEKGEGWVETTLGEVCKLQNGFAFKSETYKAHGVAILRISSIQNGAISDNRPVFVDPSDYDEDLRKYEVKENDLLIAMSGATTGKVGFNRTGKPYLLNQRVGKFEPSAKLLKSFLYYFLYTKVDENLKMSAGSAQPNLSSKQILEMQISLPDIVTQGDICNKIAEFDTLNASLAVSLTQKLAAIAELKQSVLQRAFAGELTSSESVAA